MDTYNSQKSSIELYCDKCKYVANRKSDLVKHLKSKKHNDTLNDTKKSTYSCVCGKIYKFHSGYYRHKKKCDIIENKGINNDISNTQLAISNDTIIQILNDNKELKNIIIQQQNQLLKQQEKFSELIPKVGNNNNNTINNNQKFNINVFLNEQCKDAINLSDFIKSINVTIEQLDFTKQNGLADGLSKTIIDNMSKLSIYQRPMHCTDIKRETLYIKEDNEWSKEKAKEKVKNVIRKTSSKNYNALMDWKTLNPDYMNNEDKTDYFTKTISTIGKSTDSIDEKVIKKLCKETYVKNSEN